MRATISPVSTKKGNPGTKPVTDAPPMNRPVAVVITAIAASIVALIIAACAPTGFSRTWYVGSFTTQNPQGTEKTVMLLNCNVATCEYKLQSESAAQMKPAIAVRGSTVERAMTDIPAINRDYQYSRQFLAKNPSAVADARNGELLRPLAPIFQRAPSLSRCVDIRFDTTASNIVLLCTAGDVDKSPNDFVLAMHTMSGTCGHNGGPFGCYRFVPLTLASFR